ncbi:hypothetical protein ZWY2020_026537 [Hordeum vulgare]|nr:hypothetical protein ZWY2020_026537 [Hordeum vulgare]
MALRQICMCVCLLLAVALAGGVPSPALPRAAAVLATENCSKTATGVPRWCAGEFSRALFSGGKDGPISHYCCELLACVREWTCDSLIRRFCGPPPALGYECPPTRASLAPAAAIVDGHD